MLWLAEHLKASNDRDHVHLHEDGYAFICLRKRVELGA
jgi:hypothetical protein